MKELSEAEMRKIGNTSNPATNLNMIHYEKMKIKKLYMSLLGEAYKRNAEKASNVANLLVR